MAKLIPENIGAAFTYHPLTGRIYNQLGHVCSSKVTRGDYLKLSFAGKDYVQHRVAWFLYYGEQPPEQIDHHNGNGLDNSASNLRPANNSTNQMNIGATSKSTTGIKGIFPIRGGKLYRAEVCVAGRRYQKCSADPSKLEQWVVDKRNELHGQYAHH